MLGKIVLDSLRTDLKNDEELQDSLFQSKEIDEALSDSLKID